MTSTLKSLRTSLAQKREKKGRLEEELKVVRLWLRNHESDIEKNKNFTYTVDEQVIDTKPTEPGFFESHCGPCNLVCHNKCPFNNDQRKQSWNFDYGPDGEYCKVCPQHCHWSKHKNVAYSYVIRITTVTKTAEDVKRRYEEATQRKAESEILVASISKKLEKVNNEIFSADRKLVI